MTLPFFFVRLAVVSIELRIIIYELAYEACFCEHGYLRINYVYTYICIYLPIPT
jgi:hypothetical protein